MDKGVGRGWKVRNKERKYVIGRQRMNTGDTAIIKDHVRGSMESKNSRCFLR